MKNHPRVFLALFFAFLSSAAYSNGRLFPGYYITKRGDTVFCQIEYKDWHTNPKMIVVDSNHVIKTFSPADIQGFGVTGYVDYFAARVTYHTNPITGSDIPKEYSEDTITEVCFLKVIINGAYSLYELNLPQRPYYFIKERDGEVSELIYRMKDQDGTLIPEQRYRGTFADLFEKEHIPDQYQYLILSATYSRSSLERLVNKLNEVQSDVKFVRSPAKANNRRLIQLDVFAGGMQTSFPTTFSGIIAPSVKMPSFFSPVGGLNLRLILPGNFGAFSLGLSAEYTTFKTNTTISGISNDSLSATWVNSTAYTEHLSASNTLLMTNLYAMYVFTKYTKVKLYGKAGISLDFLLDANNREIFSNYSTNTTLYANGLPGQPEGSGQSSRTVMTFSSLAAGADAAIGLMAGRHRLEFMYYTPKNLGTPGEPSFKLKQLALYYYFTILR